MSTELQLYSSLTQFSSELYGQVVADQNLVGDNVFLSPLSIYLALLMTLVGAGGQTRTEMRNSLHIPPNLEGDELHKLFGSTSMKQLVNIQDVNISLANRLFVLRNVKIHRNFKRTLEESYSAEVEVLSQCDALENKRQRMNHWVSEKTNSMINELFPENAITSDTVLTIVNAVYFKGFWKYPFEKSATKFAPFNSLDGTSMDVPMMFMVEKLSHIFLKEFASQAVKIPFGDGLWELLIVLPDQQDGLPDLLTRFRNSDTLASILAKTFHPHEVSLHLPRFKLAELPTLNIRKMLQNGGLNSLFETSADLSKMSSKRNLYVSDIMHKAVIKIDEVGAEAVAASGIQFVFLSWTEPIDFVVDHPFFMALLYKSTVPAFIGHVFKPEVK